MSQQVKLFKQRYYRNINTLWLCRPVLLPGNFQSENVTAGEEFKQRYFRKSNNLILCRPVLISGYLQSEHVAEAENFPTTILSEH